MASEPERGLVAEDKGEEILACEQAGVAVTLPKPQTSGAHSKDQRDLSSTFDGERLYQALASSG